MGTMHDAINAARAGLEEPRNWDFGDMPCPGDPELQDDAPGAWADGYYLAREACDPQCVAAYWFDRTVCDWVFRCQSCDSAGGGEDFWTLGLPTPSAAPDGPFWDKLNSKWDAARRASAPSSFDAENENETF